MKRAQTGEERIEDKIDSNINSLQGVDVGLPFLIADMDLEVDGKTTFSFDEMKHYKNTIIEKNGWRIPTIEDLQYNLDKPFLKFTYEDYTYIELKNTKNNNSVIFDFPKKTINEILYWLVDSPITGPRGENRERYWQMFIRHTFDISVANSFPNEIVGDYQDKNIRLIKDK